MEALRRAPTAPRRTALWLAALLGLLSTLLPPAKPTATAAPLVSEGTASVLAQTPPGDAGEASGEAPPAVTTERAAGADPAAAQPPSAGPPPQALWQLWQWQHGQALARAQWTQLQAQASLTAWAQAVLASNLLAQQTAALPPQAAPAPRPPVAPALPAAPPGANNRAGLQAALALDGSGLCGLTPGHVCQVGGDLAGSTVTLPVGASSASQWRVLVPAGRIPTGAAATVFVPTTRGIEFFDCPAPTPSAPTICTGQTRGHALQSGTARVHVANAVVAQGVITGPGVVIQKLLIAVPGIDATQTTSLYDPYQRASNFFGPAVCDFSPCTSLFPALGCPSAANAPSTTLVACGASGLAWLPYSYAGVSGSGANGTPNQYSGANTGQPLATSSAAMTQTISLARALLGPRIGPNTEIILIGHSLGGAVASDWAGGNAPDVPVITMDSPVNGIWPTDDTLFNTYCSSSTGLLDVYNLSAIVCGFLDDLPALNSPVVLDLQNPAIIARMGRANAINFANPADLIVPSWYAVNRQARRGAVLFVSNCGAEEVNHDCILGFAPAIAAATAIITSGIYPTPTPTRATINLNVTVTVGGSPAPNVPIQVTQGSSPTCLFSCNPPSVTIANTTTNSQGTATVSVPWRDTLLTANVGTFFGATCLAAALPANNTDLNVTIAADRGIGCDFDRPDRRR